MRSYKQLSPAQRRQIEILNKAGKNQKETAQLLGVSPATICRELKRNMGQQGYCPKQAQIKTDERRKQAAKALKMTPALIVLIEAKIIMDWSPEKISGWLKNEQGIAISHERIYQLIRTDSRHGGTLYKHLRQNNKKHKKQHGAKDQRGQIRDSASIDERPVIVAEKTRPGNCEIDTAIGQNHQEALVSVVDRMSNSA